MRPAEKPSDKKEEYRAEQNTSREHQPLHPDRDLAHAVASTPHYNNHVVVGKVEQMLIGSSSSLLMNPAITNPAGRWRPRLPRLYWLVDRGENEPCADGPDQ